MADEFGEGRLWSEKHGTSVSLGITTLGAKGLGGIESVSLPDEDTSCEEGDVLATIEGTQGSLELYAPRSGWVKAVNTAVIESPELIEEDPLEEGWLVRLEVELGDEEEAEEDDDEEDFQDEDDES
jgi:glycine cleavage system H protein